MSRSAYRLFVRMADGSEVRLPPGGSLELDLVTVLTDSLTRECHTILQQIAADIATRPVGIFRTAARVTAEVAAVCDEVGAMFPALARAAIEDALLDLKRRVPPA